MKGIPDLFGKLISKEVKFLPIPNDGNYHLIKGGSIFLEFSKNEMYLHTVYCTNLSMMYRNVSL